VQEARDQIRRCAATDPGAASDAAWAAADTLYVAASALRSPVLRQAADSYARAARMPYARIPRPTPAGNGLRQAARLLSRVASASQDSTLDVAALIANLAALVEAVIELRELQHHAAQARVAAGRARCAPPRCDGDSAPCPDRYHDGGLHRGARRGNPRGAQAAR